MIIVALLVVLGALVVAVKLRRSEGDDMSPAERAATKNGIVISSAYANQSGSAAVIPEARRSEARETIREILESAP